MKDGEVKMSEEMKKEENFEKLAFILEENNNKEEISSDVDFDVFSDNDLTLFEKNFCLNYVANGGNAYKAALASGWTENTAKSKSYKLVEKVGIKKYIAKLFEEKAKKVFGGAVMTEHELLVMWSEIARGTMVNPNALPQEQYDKQLSFFGEDYSYLGIPLSERQKASVNIAKYIGIFKDAAPTVNVINDYSNLSDEELQKIIESKIKKE